MPTREGAPCALPTSVPTWPRDARGACVYGAETQHNFPNEMPLLLPCSFPWVHMADHVFNSGGLREIPTDILLHYRLQHDLTVRQKLYDTNAKLRELRGLCGVPVALAEYVQMARDARSQPQHTRVLSEWKTPYALTETQFLDDFACPCRDMWVFCDRKGCEKLCQSVCLVCEEAYCSEECMAAEWSGHQEICEIIMENYPLASVVTTLAFTNPDALTAKKAK